MKRKKIFLTVMNVVFLAIIVFLKYRLIFDYELVAFDEGWTFETWRSNSGQLQWALVIIPVFALIVNIILLWVINENKRKGSIIEKN